MCTALLSVLLLARPATALRAAEADHIDFYIEHVGVPRTNALPNHAAWLASSAFHLPSHADAADSDSSVGQAASLYADSNAQEAETLNRYRAHGWLPSTPSAAQYLTPRFHRIINPQTYKDGDKTQTAVYVATERNVLAALNPRNGGVGGCPIAIARHRVRR